MWSQRKIRNSTLYQIFNPRGKMYQIVESDTRAKELVKEYNVSGTPTPPPLYDGSKRQFTESIRDSEKRRLAKQIRDYSSQELEKDYQKLCDIGCDASNQSVYVTTGNKVVDQYTFEERLNTISRNRLSFYEFWENIYYFKNKPNIKKLLNELETSRKTESEYVRLYNVYRLYYGAVNIFRPILAMEYYCLYQPKTVLDFTMGWGGRLVGACALNIPKYIGIDANTRLEQHYEGLKTFLAPRTNTQIELYFKDALEIDYSKLQYDMVFTSPPYYNTEKYQHMTVYNNKEHWDELFYRPLLYQTYKYLKKGGVYCLNISVEIYTRVCVGLLGEATTRFPMKKNNRHNKSGARTDHFNTEYIYVWKK
jgi:hypothetical protein